PYVLANLAAEMGSHRLLPATDSCLPDSGQLRRSPKGTVKIDRLEAGSPIRDVLSSRLTRLLARPADCAVDVRCELQPSNPDIATWFREGRDTIPFTRRRSNFIRALVNKAGHCRKRCSRTEPRNVRRRG